MTTRLGWFPAEKRPGTRAVTNSWQLQNNCPLFVWQNKAKPGQFHAKFNYINNYVLLKNASLLV